MLYSRPETGTSTKVCRSKRNELLQLPMKSCNNSEHSKLFRENVWTLSKKWGEPNQMFGHFPAVSMTHFNELSKPRSFKIRTRNSEIWASNVYNFLYTMTYTFLIWNVKKRGHRENQGEKNGIGESNLINNPDKVDWKQPEQFVNVNIMYESDFCWKRTLSCMAYLH